MHVKVATEDENITQKKITVKMNWGKLQPLKTQKHQLHHKKNKHATKLKQIFSGISKCIHIWSTFFIVQKTLLCN